MTTAPQVEAVSKKRSWRRPTAGEPPSAELVLQIKAASNLRSSETATQTLEHSGDAGENASFPAATATVQQLLQQKKTHPSPSKPHLSLRNRQSNKPDRHHESLTDLQP